MNLYFQFLISIVVFCLATDEATARSSTVCWTWMSNIGLQPKKVNQRRKPFVAQPMKTREIPNVPEPAQPKISNNQTPKPRVTQPTKTRDITPPEPVQQTSNIPTPANPPTSANLPTPANPPTPASTPTPTKPPTPITPPSPPVAQPAPKPVQTTPKTQNDNQGQQTTAPPQTKAPTPITPPSPPVAQPAPEPVQTPNNTPNDNQGQQTTTTTTTTYHTTTTHGGTPVTTTSTVTGHSTMKPRPRYTYGPQHVGPVRTWIIRGGGKTTRNGLWDWVQDQPGLFDTKISIIGTGSVGSTVAYSIITQNLADEVVLIGKDAQKVLDQVSDLKEGTGFIKSTKIKGGDDYELTKNSKICIVTAGAPRASGQKREDLVKENVKLFEDIIPKLVAYNPETIIIVVTNPVDIMAQVTWKLVGEKSTYKVIGTGTNLDSQRMRFFIAQDLRVSPESVHGFVIGEHGDSSVLAWSGVNVAGVNLKEVPELNKHLEKMGVIQSGEDWFGKMQGKVVSAGQDVIKLKGRTNWAVALSVTNLVHSILHNVPEVHAVSTLVQGYHDINEEVFMSLPCILGETGVTHILKQNLSDEEKDKLQEAARKMKGIMDGLQLGT